MSVTVYGKITIFNKKINDLYREANSDLEKKATVLDYCFYVDKLLLSATINNEEAIAKRAKVDHIDALLVESTNRLNEKIAEAKALCVSHGVDIIEYNKDMENYIHVVTRSVVNRPFTYDIIWNHGLIWRLFSILSKTQYLLLLVYNVKKTGAIDGEYVRANFRKDFIVHVKSVLYNAGIE